MIATGLEAATGHVPDLSVVVTTHGEGRVLVPTLRSLAAAVDRAQLAGMSVEVLFVMDRTDAETERVLDAHAFADGTFPAPTQAVRVDNGDLGASRNDGIRAAKADIVTVLDGDNLITSNWLLDGYEQVSRHTDPIIVHPELVASFGGRRTMWPLTPTDSQDFRPELFAAVNYWDACVMARRAVFAAVPYRFLPPFRGYGPEDWTWNMQTLDVGFAHQVVRRTALFYRVRPGSLLAEHSASVLPPVPYLASLSRARDIVARFGMQPSQAPDGGIRDSIRRAIPHRVRRPASLAMRAGKSVLRPWVHGARLVANKFGAPHTPAKLPSWLSAEWALANRIEPEIPFLRTGTLETYSEWGSPWGPWDEERALAYWRLVEALGGAVDYLFVAPWVRTGGGDLVLVQYIEAVRRLDPDASIALLTTESAASTRLRDIADGVRVIELREHFSEFVDREWIVGHLLPQLLTQLPPKTLHVFNSTVGFDVVERFGRQLGNDSAIFLSSFVTDRTPDGERTSVLFYRHSRFLTNVEAVLVDSVAFADGMVREHGYAVDKFRVIHQIVPEIGTGVVRVRRDFSQSAPLRVLWAARFDLQKRIDILAAIAAEVQQRGLPVEIDFFGEEVMGDPGLEASLTSLAESGARRRSAYRTITDLSLDSFDAFLMTSEWEGVPNTLLEVMSAGLPAIAPLVGGVSEVLDTDTGYPVSTYDDVALYVDALESMLGDYDTAASRGSAGSERVRQMFSQDAFDESLRELPHYLGGRDGLDNHAGGTTRFSAEPETVQFLATDAPRVYLFSGSQGHANFGDILQPKGVIQLWKDQAPDVEPVLFFHVGVAQDAEHIQALKRWYGVNHIIFSSRDDEDVPAPLLEVGESGASARVHVIGGGFLNATWGIAYLHIIESIAHAFRVDEYLFSGMQLDAFIVPHLASFAERQRVVAIGVRDDESYAISVGAFGERVTASFDDLYEAVAQWSTGREAAPSTIGTATDAPFRLGLHINASDYVGGQAVIDEIKERVAQVLTAYPDAELVLLNAYDDRRPEVLDTLASLRLFDDAFPFDRYEVVDLARIALEDDLGTPEVPVAIAELRLDAAITCSYHTTMLMHVLGIPAYLIRLNDYYAQKAVLFDLPMDFAEFLSEPSLYRREFVPQVREREAWLIRVREWIGGAPFPPLSGSTR